MCDADRLSYAEADRRSAQLARGLIALGAGKGTHVGVLYPNGAEFVVAMLAAARIGAVVIPFSTFATAPELARPTRSQRRRDPARHCVLPRHTTTATRLADIDDAAIPLLRHVADRLRTRGTVDDGAARGDGSTTSTASDPLAIVYTSGSTERAQGRGAHPCRRCSDTSRILNEIRGLTADDKLFCNSPFFWIGGFAFGCWPRWSPVSTLVCSNAVDAGETLDLLEAEQPTMTNGFAAGIAHLARHPQPRASAICRRCGAATCTRSWRPMCGLPIPNCGTTCSA